MNGLFVRRQYLYNYETLLTVYTYDIPLTVTAFGASHRQL